MRLAIFAILALTIAGCTAAGPVSSSVATATSAAPAARSSPTPSAAPPAQASASPLEPSPVPAPIIATGAKLVRAVTARALDSAGKPVDETTTFNGATDRSIVLAVDITGATPATTVGYRRYLETTFVDGKNTHPTRPGDGTVTFSWTKSGSASYPAGAYVVHVLIDGRDAATVRFTVR